MEVFYVFSGITYFMGQACCWYYFFDSCGCIDQNHRRFQNIEMPPPAPKERNPFKNPNIPRDEHLQSAYD